MLENESLGISTRRKTKNHGSKRFKKTQQKDAQNREVRHWRRGRAKKKNYCKLKKRTREIERTG